MHYRWLNEMSLAFMGRDYLNGLTVPERVGVIARRAGQILGIPGFADKFEDYVARGWFSLSTPIWANFGNDRGLPISCFGSHVGDDMASILHAHAEVGMMSKYGGGTSASFANLRGRGSPIRGNGQSSGAVHFMGLFDSLVSVVSQGSTRRGSFAAYLPVDHPDIMEFLGIKSEGHPLQDISFGVTVADAWMEAMIAGDAEKRKVWARVLECRASVGYPYIIFLDNANNGAPDVYRDKGMPITQSNLCVTGDQRVVSSMGLLTAGELHEQGGWLDLFDNERRVDATPMKLVERDADVYRITLANGMTHDVTGYHRVRVRTGANPVRHQDVGCLDLRPGDLVSVQTNKGLFGKVEMEDEAFLLGTYQTNGTQAKETVFLDVWEHSFDLIPEIEERFSRMADRYEFQGGGNGRTCNLPRFFDCMVGDSPVAKKRLGSRGLKKWGFEKGQVPPWIWRGTEATQWQYIRGLFYADGTASVSDGHGEPLHLGLSSIDREFLGQVQLILANLGVTASLGQLKKAGRELLPDGRGGKAWYDTKACYRLTVSNKPDAIEFERTTGFLSRKGVVLEDRHYRDNTKKHHAVVSVEPIGKQDVYCCTVFSDEHHFVCNGIVTHNCTEIFEPTAEDESFVCDLASMNILYYDEWKDTDAVEVVTFFLDAVMSEFIAKARDIPFMERAVRFAERHRALGIGWLGWHSYLQSKMVPFESMEAKRLNVDVARTIRDRAYAASAKLAGIFGEPELLRGYDRRNTTLLAIAPTQSSSFILGQVSPTIEAEPSNYYIRDLQKGKFTIKNRFLEELLARKGRDDPATWESILVRGGSVQHLDCLSDDEKAVFKTSSEISPREMVIQAAQRQGYIDQGQSLNLLISPDAPVKDVNALVIEAWRLGIKSLYYQKSVNAAQQFARNILACSSCEG